MILFMTSVQTLYLLDFNNYSNQQTMKKNEIFTFKAPNGAEVTAVVIGDIFQNSAQRCFICYAQNRIFTYIEERWRKDETTNKWLKDYSYGETLVDYAVLPDYDAMLEAEQFKLDADDFYEAVGNACEMIVDSVINNKNENKNENIWYYSSTR